MKTLRVDRYDRSKDRVYDLTHQMVSYPPGQRAFKIPILAEVPASYLDINGELSPWCEHDTVTVTLEKLATTKARKKLNDTIIWGDTTIELWDYWYETYQLLRPSDIRVS